MEGFLTRKVLGERFLLTMGSSGGGDEDRMTRGRCMVNSRVCRGRGGRRWGSVRARYRVQKHMQAHS
jgi:hypothetical protein